MELLISHQSALEFWRGAPAKEALAGKRSRTKVLPVKAPDSRKLPRENPWGLTTPLHLLVGDDSARRAADGLRCHIGSGIFPPGSFIQVEPGLTASSPELCFVQMASELPLVELMMLGYEFCGSYRLDKVSAPEQGFRKDIPLTSAVALEAFVAKATGLKGCKNARKALRFVADGSASPMETALTLLLCLPYRFGGYGLPMPQLNWRIEVNIAARNISGMSGESKFYGDLYWPEEQIDVEYDSDAHHSTHEQAEHDSSRRNALQSAGVAVFSVSRTTIMNTRKTRELAEGLSRLLEKRLRCPAPEFTLRHFKLRQQLLPR
ncbi:MAG: hypothetical protein FWC54_06445 [Actinomycetia bacterium]|nr:hypothetical protein [Actinomycetes bacterium]